MIPTLTIANAKAVSLLEHGQHQDAVRILSCAVKQCASALFDDPSRSLPHADTLSSCGDLFVTTAVPVNSNPYMCAVETEFFSRPFVMIHHNDLEAKSSSRQIMAGCAAVCCYNMGLACHLEWIRRNRNDSRVLNQAHTFYRKAFNVLQFCHLKPTDSLLLLLMAVCTNMIGVNLELGRLSDVQNLKDNLASVMTYADKRQYKHNESFRYLYHAIVLFRSDLVAARAA